MKTNKPTRKTKKKSTIKKQVKQHKSETVLGKIKNVLGDTAAKIKTLLPVKAKRSKNATVPSAKASSD